MLNDNVPRLDAMGHAHECSKDGVHGKNSGRVILSRAVDDWVIRGTDLEEVARLEALEVALRPRGDAVEGMVVVLHSTTNKEILRLVGNGEGELGEGGEGDLLLHRPVRLDADGRLGGLGVVAETVELVVRAAVLLPVVVATSMLLLDLVAAHLDLLIATLRELGPLLEAPLGAEPRVAG
jgi:hypothetical protein